MADEERPEEDLNPIPEGEVAKVPQEVPGLSQEGIEPEEASEETLEPLPLVEKPGKSIGLEPVFDEPLPPLVATRQPVERLGPQEGMSLKEDHENWEAGGKVGPRPGMSPEEYMAGQYAQHPEPDVEAAKVPQEAPGLPFGDSEPERASEPPELPESQEMVPDSPELPDTPVVVSKPALEPLVEESGKPIGIEPVPDELPPPVATRQPVERLGPQEGMSLKERYARREAMGGDEAGLPPLGRAAPGYEAGEYAQHPEPEMPEDAGRGPGMEPSDPFGLADKPPPEAPKPEPPEVKSPTRLEDVLGDAGEILPDEPPAVAKEPTRSEGGFDSRPFGELITEQVAKLPMPEGPMPSGVGGTDALADTVKESNEAIKGLVTDVKMLMETVEELKGGLDEIKESLGKDESPAGTWG